MSDPKSTRTKGNVRVPFHVDGNGLISTDRHSWRPYKVNLPLKRIVVCRCQAWNDPCCPRPSWRLPRPFDRDSDEILHH